MKRTKISRVNDSLLGKVIRVCGWIRTVRSQKNFSFIALYDGSHKKELQIVYDATTPGYEKTLEALSTGTSVFVTGEVVRSPGEEQSVEIKASAIEIYGLCPAEYPLQKKRHSFEFLREIAHLRTRTNTQGSVLRVRSRLAFATHKFFQEEGFVNLHTPIITTSDCEGAGEAFCITTLDLTKVPKTEFGAPDFSQDFFKKQAFLTVSGQLNAEAVACAISDVYTFGPTFRAENSNTTRHLAEFWMIEPEMAFATLTDVRDLAERYIKYALKDILTHCKDDLSFFDQFIQSGLVKRLETLVSSSFETVTYTEAIEILKNSNVPFNFPVSWGMDLQTEHERYLAEKHFNGPVFVTNYPSGIKAFYMRANDDGKTVAAMDLLVPGIGELLGGSQREERHEILKEKIIANGLNPTEYDWYLDLRKYGTVPHAGFGVGFERLIQFATGMENIRDVIPFPRFPGNADF